MPGESQAKLIYANATISQAGAGNWTKVNLTQAYTSPIVVFGPLTRADGTAAHIRVNNVKNVDPANANRASFEYQVDEWDFMDGVHAPETASYMVMEAGVYAIGGQVVQAGANTGVTNVGVTQYASSDYWSSDIFYEREPVIFAQCVPVNETSAPRLNSLASVATVTGSPLESRRPWDSRSMGWATRASMPAPAR